MAIVRLMALVYTATGCRQSGRGATPPSRPPQRITLSQLREQIAATIEAAQVPGVGLALVNRDRVIWSGGVGVADAASGRPVTADTFFRVASIEKSLIAAAILQLQERGKLKLDDAVPAMAPELDLENRWAAQAPVTIAEVLEHTEGMRDCAPAQFYDFRPRGAPLTAIEFFKRFPDFRRARWRPGEFFSYSNPGYVAAGYLIRKASGLPYDVYLRREILVPLGMRETSNKLTPAIAARMAVGYGQARRRPVPYRPVYPDAATALISSPAEMALFVRMLLDGGTLDDKEILSPESVARMQIPRTSAIARAGVPFGYALGMGAELERGRRVYSNEGSIEGYLSRFEYVPSAGVGYFFAINGSDGAAARAKATIRGLILDYLLQDRPREPSSDSPAAANPAPKLEHLERFAGRYELVTTGQAALPVLDELYGAITIYERDGKLYQRSPDEPVQTLIPVADGQFRQADEESPSRVFFEDSNGRRMLQTPDGGYRRTTSAWPVIRLWLVRGALVLILTEPLAALLWLAPAILTGGLGSSHNLIGIVLAIAAGCLVICNRVATASSDFQLAYLNGRTLAFWAGGWAFAVLAVGGFVLALLMLREREIETSVRIYWTAVSATFAMMAGWLAAWGVIGYKFWIG